MDFKKLKPREKLIVLGLALVVVFSVYMKVVHEPFAKKVQAAKTNMKKTESQLAELKVKYPPIGTQREKIKSLSQECERLTDQSAGSRKCFPPGRRLLSSSENSRAWPKI